jgi:histone-arginine methyltransferase CARM1
MIGDISRTGTYRKAILGNSAIAFNNKNVLDLGAGMLSCLVMLIPGSGILSFISAQAGAKQVIALEASSMADKMAVVSLIPISRRDMLMYSL